MTDCLTTAFSQCRQGRLDVYMNRNESDAPDREVEPVERRQDLMGALVVGWVQFAQLLIWDPAYWQGKVLDRVSCRSDA